MSSGGQMETIIKEIGGKINKTVEELTYTQEQTILLKVSGNKIKNMEEESFYGKGLATLTTVTGTMTNVMVSKQRKLFLSHIILNLPHLIRLTQFRNRDVYMGKHRRR